VLAPLAFLKLQFFLHAGETEIGGFGISRAADDLLYVEDFVTVRQAVSCVTVEFDDAAVADHFDAMVDDGKVPAQFARIWVHTHPGSSAQPSGTDEETFERAFGRCDWSIMFILSRSGQTYARLRLVAGPKASLLLPVRVDWAAWANVVADLGGEGLSELAEAWMDEYGQNVRPVFELPMLPTKNRPPSLSLAEDGFFPIPSERGRMFDEHDRIDDPDAQWWQMEDELAALAEIEAAEYFGGSSSGGGSGGEVFA
jgi:proteasome lid subunit RPN8/RPN11